MIDIQAKTRNPEPFLKKSFFCLQRKKRFFWYLMSLRIKLLRLF